MKFDHVVAADLYQRSQQVSREIDKITRELKTMVDDAKRAPDMAETFVLLKNIREEVDSSLKDLTKLRDAVSYNHLPEMMEDEGLTSFNTETGYRVSVARRFSASMVDKQQAFAWLRENDLGDIIQETVPSQTLSAQIRELIESEGIEPPDDIIKTSIAPYSSVVKTKKK